MRTFPLALLFAVGVSIACAGTEEVVPEAVENTQPREAAASGGATQGTGFDRSKHNGLPEGMASWAVFKLVAEERTPAHAVVLWGSKNEEEAWTWLETYLNNGGPTRPGYPYVVASENIDGMNPGFYVVIAAEPTSKEVAEELTAMFKRLTVGGESLDGTYIKPVQIPLPETSLRAEDMRPG